MNARRRPGAGIVVCGLLLGAMGGILCALLRQRTPPALSKSPPPFLPPTRAQLAEARVNELGLVPILEYHSIDSHKSKMSRSVARFRKDLLRLYAEGYRPVSLHDYLDNRIDVPLGKTPVIFTFDDARKSQFCYRRDGTLDPDCAVAILQEFHRNHPDFRLKATFFVLPWRGFDQPRFIARKMQELLSMGCELGNHTVTHPILSRVSDERVKAELATCAAVIRKLAPQAQVDVFALPYGVMPRNRSLLASGSYDGMHYKNRAVFLAAGNPARSPVSRKFRPMYIPRIEAVEGRMGLTFWLDRMKRYPQLRYVSDGDPNTVTVPTREAGKVDKSRLNGAALRTY